MKRWLAERGLSRASIAAGPVKTAAAMQAALDAFKRMAAQEQLQPQVDLQAVSVVENGRGRIVLHVEDAAVRRAEGRVDSAGPPAAEMLPHPLYYDGEESDDAADEEDYQEEEEDGYGHEYGGGGGFEEAEDGEAGGEEEQSEDEDLVNCAEEDEEEKDEEKGGGQDNDNDTGRGCFEATDSPSPGGEDDPCRESSDTASPAFSVVYGTVLALLQARKPDLMGIKRALMEQCGWKGIHASSQGKSCILAPWAQGPAADPVTVAAGRAGLDFFCDTKIDDVRLLEALAAEDFQKRCAEFLSAGGGDSQVRERVRVRDPSDLAAVACSGSSIPETAAAADLTRLGEQDSSSSSATRGPSRRPFHDADGEEDAWIAADIGAAGRKRAAEKEKGPGEDGPMKKERLSSDGEESSNRAFSSCRPALSLSKECLHQDSYGGSSSSSCRGSSWSSDGRSDASSGSDSGSGNANGISEHEELAKPKAPRGGCGGGGVDGPPAASHPASHTVSPLASDSASPQPAERMPQEDLTQPYLLTTTTTTATSSGNDSQCARAKIEEYWQLQARKMSKGLLLPVVFEESCLRMVRMWVGVSTR